MNSATQNFLRSSMKNRLINYDDLIKKDGWLPSFLIKSIFYYLSSTWAPASSSFFLASMAASLPTPVKTLEPAVSPSVLASGSLVITSNSVFSSTGSAAAAAPPGATIATGAAAETPHFSSSALTNSAASSTERVLSSST